MADVRAEDAARAPGAPAPAAEAWNLVEQQEWGELRPLLHPYVRYNDRGTRARPSRLLAHLRDDPTPRPPVDVEVRDGQLHRWIGRGVESGFLRCEAGVLLIVYGHNLDWTHHNARFDRVAAS